MVQCKPAVRTLLLLGSLSLLEDVGDAQAACILFQSRIHGDRRRNRKQAKLSRDSGVDVDYVVVRRRENGLQNSDELLVDSPDFLALGIDDRKVPGPPVLGLNPPQLSPAGVQQIKADLAEYVALGDCP